jgi:hypothetical protein
MGPFRAGRFQQLTISRQRARLHPKTDETDEYTPTSGSFGYDKTRQETLNWGDLDDGDGDDLDETHRR